MHGSSPMEGRVWQPLSVPPARPGTGFSHLPGNIGLSLEHPMAKHGHWPCCGVAVAGTDSPGGLKCGPGLWQGGDNTERVEQGQEGLMVCQGHGGVIFCTHLLCMVLETENIPWRRRYGSKPFPPRGVSINPSLITGGYPCVSVLPPCKTQSKVVSSFHGNHCIQVRLGEPSLVLSLGGCLVSMGLCNLPTIISAPVTVCAYISVLSWKMWNLHCYISYWTFVCISLNICFSVNTSVLKPWVTLKIKISSVW